MTTEPKATIKADRVTIEGDGIDVSGLLMRPETCNGLLVLGHGAGAGMDHPHLERLAQQLAHVKVATLRYQFPYKEKGSGRPDRAPVLEATVAAAVARARELAPELETFVGGRSMGARMAARAHASERLPVKGLVFFAFPLHRPVNLSAPDPTLERAAHPLAITDPMLFLAGTRDRLSRLHLLEQTVNQIDSATLHVIDTADHSFQPTKKSGRTLADVEQELAHTTVSWMLGL